MPIFRCQSVMQWETGLPEDITVNTFHVQAATLNGTMLTTAWEDFMNDIQGLFGDVVAGSGHLLKVYNLADAEPRAPVHEGSWAFGVAPSGETLPTEVALCVSYRGERISGTNPRRRRGRMYLGPLNDSSNVSGRPNSTYIDAIMDAFVTFDLTLGTEGHQFVIYSRVDEGPVYPTLAWVDNAFDTQRRRGYTPDTRDSRALSYVEP